jgi:hypothetical protein
LQESVPGGAGISESPGVVGRALGYRLVGVKRRFATGASSARDHPRP